MVAFLTRAAAHTEVFSLPGKDLSAAAGVNSSTW